MVLGNSSNRAEYDRKYLERCDASIGAQWTSPKSNSTPDQKSQPPSNSDPQDEEKSRADANAQEKRRQKRQEWLDFEQHQKEKIRQCQDRINSTAAELVMLDAKILEKEVLLSSDMFASLPEELLKAVTKEFERQILDSKTAIRIKKESLKCDQQSLQRLQDELSRRRIEDEKLAGEQKKEEREEQLRKEKARAEARAKEHAARYAKAKAKAEARARAEAEEIAQKAKFAEQRKKDDDERKRRETPSHPCRHEACWDQVSGPVDCEYCEEPSCKFALLCPGCETVACYSCSKILQESGSPPTKTTSQSQRENHRSQKGARKFKRFRFFRSASENVHTCGNNSKSNAQCV